MCLAVPAQVVSLADDSDLAVVDLQGIRREINIALVRDDGVAEGSWVLVHVGFALSIVDEDEARRSMALLQELFAADAWEGA